MEFARAKYSLWQELLLRYHRFSLVGIERAASQESLMYYCYSFLPPAGQAAAVEASHISWPGLETKVQGPYSNNSRKCSRKFPPKKYRDRSMCSMAKYSVVAFRYCHKIQYTCWSRSENSISEEIFGLGDLYLSVSGKRIWIMVV